MTKDDEFWPSAISQVRAERESMADAAKQFSEILGDDAAKLFYGRPKPEEVNKLLIEIAQHLGQIAGFCDKKGKEHVAFMTRALGDAMTNNLILMLLVDMLPKMVGIEVDFTRRPFKLVGFEVEAFAARVGAILGR